MKFGKDIRQVKAILLIIAIIIAVSSLYISNILVKDLSVEERHKMEVWAEAMRTMNTADDNMDLNLVLKVLNTNNTIPVIVVDNNNSIQLYRNISIDSKDTLRFLQKEFNEFRKTGRNINITYGDDNPSEYLNICYDNSLILKRLAAYPYIQLGIVLIFVVVAIVALLSFKTAEQNKIWVGLSKETAHQLGTPISSLMAWLELLISQHPDDKLIPAMSEDVARLQMIAGRFSKIGSAPELERADVTISLERVMDYMAHRTSDKIKIVKEYPGNPVFVKLNSPLFEWVIENICKNAVDAMGGVGIVKISLIETPGTVVIDISDTGKGINKSNYKSVFSPGYTTKKRGWGLGLSMAKRIVQEYHSGRIFVKDSEINVGTTFRIELKR